MPSRQAARPGLSLAALALALCAALWPLTLAAQQAVAAQQTASTYETDPAADPARPTITNPAHIPPPGYLQIEQGFNEAFSTPGGPDRQFSLQQATKISLNHHVMPFLLSQPSASSTDSGRSTTDPGDIDLGVQFVLLDEGEGHSHIPTLSAAYIQRLRSGSAENLDVGGFSRSVLLLASGDVDGFHYDTNFIFNEQPADSPNLPGHAPPRRAQFGQTLSVTHTLTQKLSVSGEIWRFSQPLTGGNAIGNLYALGYTVRKTLVLDAGFSHGLTGTSTTWQTFAGFTYLLPHRLWPKRQS